MWASQNSWDKIQFGKEEKTSFADDIWCIVVARGIHKVLLFENGQKKQKQKRNHPDVNMCTWHYHSERKSNQSWILFI